MRYRSTVSASLAAAVVASIVMVGGMFVLGMGQAEWSFGFWCRAALAVLVGTGVFAVGVDAPLRLLRWNRWLRWLTEVVAMIVAALVLVAVGFVAGTGDFGTDVALTAVWFVVPLTVFVMAADVLHERVGAREQGLWWWLGFTGAALVGTLVSLAL